MDLNVVNIGSVLVDCSVLVFERKVFEFTEDNSDSCHSQRGCYVVSVILKTLVVVSFIGIESAQERRSVDIENCFALNPIVECGADLIRRVVFINQLFGEVRNFY